MVNDWCELTLEESMDAIIDYRGKTPKKTDSGIPLITAKIIKSGRIETVNEFISEDDYDTWMRRGIPNEGDVVMTTEAPLGEIAQLDGRKIALAQRVITLRGKKDILDNTFLKYLMISEYVQHQLDGRGTGTTVKGIKQSELRKVVLKFPSFKEQKAIAHILGFLDDKIELNRQMNETLESMSQAFFKSWFVDFDPVIDNALAAGNAIPDEFIERAEQRKAIEKKDHSDIQALFPDEFEFTEEMGWIPKGWEVGSLDKMFELQRGFDLPKKKRTDGIYPLMAASGQDGTHNEFKVKGPNVVTGRSGKLGVVSFVHTNHWPLNTTLWVKNYDKSNPYHAYFFLQTLDLDRYNSGSAVPSLNRNNVHNLIQILPSKVVLDKFQEVVESNFAKIAENNSGIEILTKLRDTLLPKLMSGELRISDDIL